MPRAFLLNGTKKRSRPTSAEGGDGERDMRFSGDDEIDVITYEGNEMKRKSSPRLESPSKDSSPSLKVPCFTPHHPDHFKASENSAFERVKRMGLTEPLMVATSHPRSRDGSSDRGRPEKRSHEESSGQTRVRSVDVPRTPPYYPATTPHPAAGIPGLEHLRPGLDHVSPYMSPFPHLGVPSAMHPDASGMAAKMLHDYARAAASAAAASAASAEMPKIHDFLQAAAAYQDGHMVNFWLAQARFGLHQGHPPPFFQRSFNPHVGLDYKSPHAGRISYMNQNLTSPNPGSPFYDGSHQGDITRCARDASYSSCRTSPKCIADRELLPLDRSRETKEKVEPCSPRNDRQTDSSDDVRSSTSNLTKRACDRIPARTPPSPTERISSCADEDTTNGDQLKIEKHSDDELTEKDNERMEDDEDEDEEAEEEREIGEIPRGSWGRRSQSPHYLSPHGPQTAPFPSQHLLHPGLYPDSGHHLRHPLLPGLPGPAPGMTMGPGASLMTMPGTGRRPRDPTKPPPMKKYKCDLCGKAFSRSNTLVTHRRIHTGEKPFKCEVCGRAFRQPGNLTRHRLTHTTVKPYVCPLCKKAFNRASNLHTHMRTHTNFKSFICPYCGKGFHQKIDMKIHCYTHTGRPTA